MNSNAEFYLHVIKILSHFNCEKVPIDRNHSATGNLLIHSHGMHPSPCPLPPDYSEMLIGTAVCGLDVLRTVLALFMENQALSLHSSKEIITIDY